LPEKETQPIVGFEQMDLSKEILQAVDKMGFSQPTPVQAKTIPIMMEGHDVIAIAPTGT
jgi:superfamily II DNA/RNA helicase